MTVCRRAIGENCDVFRPAAIGQGGGGVVMRATNRRAIGATMKAVGKATDHDGSHAVIQRPMIPSTKPSARNVATPDTKRDITPDKIKAKRSGA